MNQADLLDALPWAVPATLLIVGVAIFVFGNGGDWGVAIGGLHPAYQQASEITPNWLQVGVGLLVLSVLLNALVNWHEEKTDRTNR